MFLMLLPSLNISYRRNGAVRFLKLGRLSLSWSVAKRYKPVKANSPAYRRYVAERFGLAPIVVKDHFGADIDLSIASLEKAMRH